jgi:hypothetical protein
VYLREQWLVMGKMELSMPLPEYTISLLLWVVPIVCIFIFFIRKRLLSPEKIYALGITVALLAFAGIALDLLFAHLFFLFPDPTKVCGVTIREIPIEEFVFYITGFWFIIFLYVFGDEWFLKKYNQPDARYARYRSRLKRLIFVHYRNIGYAVIILLLGLVMKRLLNPRGEFVPGYFFFLTIAAYTPAVVFYRVTRAFVNWRAFLFSMIITVLISIIWEVTLALPRGYWNYQHGAMLGIFIGVWNDLPLEAVTVWIFCTLVIFVYEFIKIYYFTAVPSVPLHRHLLKFGREWRRGKNGQGAAGVSDKPLADRNLNAQRPT